MNEELLRRAIELAAEARAGGNPPFGSLLAGPDGTVLVEERNTTRTDNDISAHPELKVARWAAANLNADAAAKTTMYTSCEPCGMCAGALARSGVGQVVFALSAAQYGELTGFGGFPAVPTDGPHLFDDAKAPIEGFRP